jgi:hypothetical protein
MLGTIFKEISRHGDLHQVACDLCTALYTCSVRMRTHPTREKLRRYNPNICFGVLLDSVNTRRLHLSFWNRKWELTSYSKYTCNEETVKARSRGHLGKPVRYSVFVITVWKYPGPNANKQYVWTVWGRVCWVGIATRCGVNGRGIESRGGRDFPHPSRPTLGLTLHPVQWVPSHSWG